MIITEEVIAKTSDIYQNTRREHIQNQSSQEIKETFDTLTHQLLQNNLLYLKQTEPNFKKLLEIPQLQDLILHTLNVTPYSADCELRGSTAFTWNLRQLLLDHGFQNNQVGIHHDGVHIALYNRHFNIYIRQKNLSA